MIVGNKGQYLSAEQMLLFSLGIVITIAVYFSFSTIHGSVEKIVVDDNLRAVGNSVASGISEVYALAKGSEPDYINLTLEIPKSISAEGYKIKTEEDKLLLTQGSRREVVPLAESGDIEVLGEVASGAGRLQIVFQRQEGNITLER